MIICTNKEKFNLRGHSKMYCHADISGLQLILTKKKSCRGNGTVERRTCHQPSDYLIK
uniref:Uncharacterized protein n=1 Tax=Arion vulgaris TaxID=1028688 RepID=A0A0B7B2K5_9EUPU